MNLKPYIADHPVFEATRHSAEALGVRAYAIGGYVRDLILKRPSKDIDIVAVGSGIELARKVAGQLNRPTEVNVFRNFGTAQVVYYGWDVEFVGARKESYNRASRKPVVEDGSLQDDQNRRDFTINALAISLSPEDFGQVLDPFGGLADLEQHTLRTPLEPGLTFSDDPLRIMRGIRFAAQLGFDIAPETFEAMREEAHRLEIVSQERITDELNKIIAAPKPSYGFKLLHHTGVLPLIFPEMADLAGVDVKDGQRHKDNFYHTLQVLDNVAHRSDKLYLRWAAILHDIAKPATKRFHPKAGWTFHGHEDLGAKWVPAIFRRLKLPMGEKMKYVQKLVRLHLRPIALVKEVTDSAIRRLIVDAGEDLDDLMLLCRCDITSKNPDKVQRFLKNFDKVERKVKEVEERDSLRNFQPPVSGEDIMEIFQIPPGKLVGVLKSQVREAILDGQLPNKRPEALQFLVRKGQEHQLSPQKVPPEMQPNPSDQ